MLRSKLFYGTGSSEFSCKLFLGVKVKDELQEYREIINEEFDQYISNTNRFKTKFFFIFLQPNLTHIPNICT